MECTINVCLNNTIVTPKAKFIRKSQLTYVNLSLIAPESLCLVQLLYITWEVYSIEMVQNVKSTFLFSSSCKRSMQILVQ